MGNNDIMYRNFIRGMHIMWGKFGFINADETFNVSIRGNYSIKFYPKRMC